MKPAALLLVFASCSFGQLREIPEILKHPGKLQPYHAVAPKHPMQIEAAAPTTCSVPLLEFKPETNSNMPVIRPNTESNMPLIELPAPPCAKPE